MDPLPDELIQELRNAIATPVVSSLRRVDIWARQSRSRLTLPEVQPRERSGTVFSLVPWLLGAGFVVAGLLYISQYGLHLKARVSQEGNAAIGNLTTAKEDLTRMDFSAAQEHFTQASIGFDSAARVLGNLPGVGNIRVAKDLVAAGQLIAQAGQSLAQAMTAISGSNASLDLAPIGQALGRADASITKAAALLAGVDRSAVPQAQRVQFDEFMAHLPEARALITQATDTVAFLNTLLGADRPRRYLLLFQNSSELRPTGGFPGSYGLVTFEKGQMRNLSTDDIYNPDGQLTELVVPPLQLQQITPAWGMRDANWFIDFPASARKVVSFYRKGGGTAVDGVIAIRPELVASLLRITGPVTLPQYNLVLTADNFLPLIQLEVESKKTPEPKKVIMDLAPILLQKISALPPASFTRLLDIVRTGLAGRDVLLYLQDAPLEKFAASQGWDGGVVQTKGDYLTVNVANIKGAKADAVTDTALKLESWFAGGTLVHRLTITRVHNGGHTPYGFYNKTNYSYVRVLVPEGSALRGISGNDRPADKPMMDYAHMKATIDPDLAALEHTYHYDFLRGVTTSEESGKTGFGFWMKVEPGKTQSVQVEYVVPARAVSSAYTLHVQRQPGLAISDFEFTLQKGPASGGTSGQLRATGANHTLTDWPDSWRLHDPLKQDLDLSLTLK